ncbi:hypothetical protein NLC29_00545 [Candidatus Aminicenantes bacterium AH-873-B07]|jgi:hypothetical protein|nr:hypothetical protein [Candidatus Aminicenantes bacterium AH-873-B07]
MKFLNKFFLLFVIFILIFTSNRAFAETNFYLFGKGNFVNSAGTEADYKEGENDFPIMSAHQTYGGGFGLSFSPKGIFLIGIEAHYNLNGKATLTDPSDNDTVEIDTYKNVSGFLTLGFNLVKSKLLSFFINGGGGIYYSLDATERIYTSRLGFETIIEPPEKRYHFAGFGGAGIILSFSESVGLLLCGRYTYIAIKEQPETMIEALAGLVFSF